MNEIDLIENYEYKFQRYSKIMASISVLIDRPEVGAWEYILCMYLDGSNPFGFAVAAVISASKRTRTAEMKKILIGDTVMTPFGNYTVTWGENYDHLTLTPKGN